VDIVLRGAVTYFVVWLILRVAGKKTLSETTTFDFVLLLIISETTQSALIDGNNSLTCTVILVVTMVGMDIVLSLWKQRSRTAERIIDGTPLVILTDGIPLKDRMDKERVGEDDILEAARQLLGLERLDQIKYAVLERDGGITVVPKNPR
jgi:uncharacterized membrane protein YcaP (DUF421 family)